MFIDESAQGVLHSNKSIGRRVITCAAAPGIGKSAFFDELLSRASSMMQCPVVPMSATFNFETDLDNIVDGYDDIKSINVAKALLCRLAYK